MWGFGDRGKGVGREVSPAQQIPLLISRAKNCSTLQDKREAVQELQGMRTEDLAGVGAEGFISLMTVLRLNADDKTICEGILMVMTELIDGPAKEQILQAFADNESSIKGVETLLTIVQEQGFHAKYNVLRFLTSLVEYHPQVVSRFSAAAGGLHSLVDILNDTQNNGILRNEGLLLMKSIAITDEEVQKIVVYENIFDSIFKIIKDEGGVQGGILVEDCLDILHHLLATNISNQKYFRDFTGLASLIPLLTFPDAQLSDSASKIVVLTIYLISYFLKGKRSDSEVQKTVNAIAGITTRKGEEIMAEASLLTGLAGVSIHPSPNPEAHIESMRCLASLAGASDKIKETLVTLVVERGGKLYKWVNHLAEYLAGGEGMRQCVAAELFAVMMQSDAVREQIGAGVVGEATDAAQPHPGKTLIAALFTSATPHYPSFIISHLLTSPSVQHALLASTYSSTPTMAALTTALTSSIRDQKTLPTHALFRVLIKWLTECIPAVAAFLSVTDLTFFVETANADGIEPISIQVLSCALIGAAKLALDDVEGEEYIKEKRTLRDALVRRIGLDRFLVRFNTLREDPAFVNGASANGISPTIALWDADLVTVVEATYEKIQKSVLNDITGPAEAHAPEATSESLKHFMQQRDADVEVLRKELAKVKAELAAARETPPVDETVASIKHNFHQKEDELSRKLMASQEQVRLLEMELEEERRRRSEDQKMADIQKRITEDNVTSMAESKAMVEKENLNLLTMVTSLEERLDQSESRLALVGQAAMDNPGLKAALDACGASRYVDSDYPSAEVATSSTRVGNDSEQLITLKKRNQQLEMDQNDLYALLGEYDERLRQLLGKRPAKTN
eukprot:TRINITY_DN4654_c0_g1_i1.p1 TRINITY_DN4654_c0_g1~~TRINITY_DN4654_c0_g1_i1.p1  ORF type:complete len:865 (+),score=199.14 TRINITY_DN4654_c0_g1_i1:38-2596(+)